MEITTSSASSRALAGFLFPSQWAMARAPFSATVTVGLGVHSGGLMAGGGMGGRPALFAELCARLGSVSLALQGGSRCRPATSTPGAKTGYATTILGVLGLHPGQGADAYLWCEPEAGPRSVLACYPDPGRLRAVAAVIQGWIGEEARSLWDRLRAEERAAAETLSSEAAARWLLLNRWSFSERGPEHGYGGPGCGVRTTTARWTTVDRDAALERPRLAGLVGALADIVWPDVAIAEDAQFVDPADVARWIALSYLSWKGDPEAGHKATGGGNWPDRPPSPANLRFPKCAAWPPAVVGPDAREVVPNADLTGAIVYIDPSYVGTTPYKHNLSRSDVLVLARRWNEVGATVAISEAVPVEGLGKGWEAVEITGGRKGNARTFSAQRREWLTLNRMPAHREAVQPGLFGEATA